MEVNGKYIVDAYTFLERYYGLDFDSGEILSHEILMEILSQHQMKVSRMRFSKINKELVLKGTCILVRDEFDEVIPYRNPYKTFSFSSDLNHDVESLKEIRLHLLNEQGFTYNEDGEVVPIKQPNFIKRLFIGGKNNDKH